MSEEVKKGLTEEEKEMLAKLAQAKTTEDVMAVAKEYGKEITKEKAKEMLENMKAPAASGELSDDDLDNVAGGVYDFYAGWTDDQLAAWRRMWGLSC